MCKCSPEIRTPFCGKLNCEWPKPEGTRQAAMSEPTKKPREFKICGTDGCRTCETGRVTLFVANDRCIDCDPEGYTRPKVDASYDAMVVAMAEALDHCLKRIKFVREHGKYESDISEGKASKALALYREFHTGLKPVGEKL